MSRNSSSYQPLFLYSGRGERKYLTPSERRKFFEALDVLRDPRKQTFAEMIYWTGCRPGEALGLYPSSVDLGEGNVVIRSSKKRGNLKGRHFRVVPVPMSFVERLRQVHEIGEVSEATHEEERPLWEFSRSTGWRIVRSVMMLQEYLA